MTTDELLRQGRLVPLEARILISHALQWSRVQLVTRSQDILSAAQLSAIDALFRRRESGEPMAYITGTREFHGLDFEVTPAVLIPRPETELLVELANERLPQNGSALDLGTGSGAVAVTLAHLRPDAQLSATDISAEALQVALRNAARHHSRVTFILSDWYRQINGLFDLIVSVSNPPYIDGADTHLAALHAEPLQALTPGPDGLSALRVLVRDAPSHLQPGGWLLLEHGHDQGAAVRSLLHAAGLEQVQTRRDLAGHERCTAGRLGPGRTARTRG